MTFFRDWVLFMRDSVGKPSEKVNSREFWRVEFHLQVIDYELEPVVGIEPTTHGLQNRCSTTELNWPNICPPKSCLSPLTQFSGQRAPRLRIQPRREAFN